MGGFAGKAAAPSSNPVRVQGKTIEGALRLLAFKLFYFGQRFFCAVKKALAQQAFSCCLNSTLHRQIAQLTVTVRNHCLRVFRCLFQAARPIESSHEVAFPTPASFSVFILIMYGKIKQGNVIGRKPAIHLPHNVHEGVEALRGVCCWPRLAILVVHFNTDAWRSSLR